MSRSKSLCSLWHVTKHPQLLLGVCFACLLGSCESGSDCDWLSSEMGPRRSSSCTKSSLSVKVPRACCALRLQTMIARHEPDLPGSGMRGNEFFDRVVHGVLARRRKADRDSCRRQLERGRPRGSLLRQNTTVCRARARPGQVLRKIGQQLRAPAPARADAGRIGDARVLAACSRLYPSMMRKRSRMHAFIVSGVRPMAVNVRIRQRADPDLPIALARRSGTIPGGSSDCRGIASDRRSTDEAAGSASAGPTNWKSPTARPSTTRPVEFERSGFRLAGPAHQATIGTLGPIIDSRPVTRMERPHWEGQWPNSPGESTRRLSPSTRTPNPGAQGEAAGHSSSKDLTGNRARTLAAMSGAVRRRSPRGRCGSSPNRAARPGP